MLARREKESPFRNAPAFKLSYFSGVPGQAAVMQKLGIQEVATRIDVFHDPEIARVTAEAGYWRTKAHPETGEEGVLLQIIPKATLQSFRDEPTELFIGTIDQEQLAVAPDVGQLCFAAAEIRVDPALNKSLVIDRRVHALGILEGFLYKSNSQQ